jgi:hypothetical protein
VYGAENTATYVISSPSRTPAAQPDVVVHPSSANSTVMPGSIGNGTVNPSPDIKSGAPTSTLTASAVPPETRLSEKTKVDSTSDVPCLRRANQRPTQPLTAS